MSVVTLAVPPSTMVGVSPAVTGAAVDGGAAVGAPVAGPSVVPGGTEAVDSAVGVDICSVVVAVSVVVGETADELPDAPLDETVEKAGVVIDRSLL